jgi:hypothetical protein
VKEKERKKEGKSEKKEGKRKERERKKKGKSRKKKGNKENEVVCGKFVCFDFFVFKVGAGKA